ncbi:MAG: DUF308 domain-containing protein [Oscillospiraceae bacterium]|nr:DUF308 domain-containing protein [Oscillospiraceae bacterium]
MKRTTRDFLNAFGTPLALILFGLILVVSPDTATALVAQLFGGLLLLIGVIWGVVLVIGRELSRVSHWIGLALCLLAGSYMIFNPMALADSIGRLFGLVMILHGAGRLRRMSHNGDGFNTGLAIVTLVVGIILVLVPRTLSQTVVGVCGLVMMVLGICNLVGGFRALKRPDDNDDPNIIDAAK